jgi:hypothetical protein
VRTRAKKPAKTESKARKNSKTARIVALLQRPNGATLETLMKATGWQAHSVRGFLSGQLRKRMHLRLKSTKHDGEEVDRWRSSYLGPGIAARPPFASPRLSPDFNPSHRTRCSRQSKNELSLRMELSEIRQRSTTVALRNKISS